jgi:hypothetical protein
MSRIRLLNRRQSETFDVEVGGLRYTATASQYEDGRIGELFLANHKSNSAADIVARDSGIAFSIAGVATPTAAPAVRSGARSICCSGVNRDRAAAQPRRLLGEARVATRR